MFAVLAFHKNSVNKIATSVGTKLRAVIDNRVLVLLDVDEGRTTRFPLGQLLK